MDNRKKYLLGGLLLIVLGLTSGLIGAVCNNFAIIMGINFPLVVFGASMVGWNMNVRM